jgi:hypothetical protein
MYVFRLMVPKCGTKSTIRSKYVSAQELLYGLHTALDQMNAQWKVANCTVLSALQ